MRLSSNPSPELGGGSTKSRAALRGRAGVSAMRALGKR